ncbi:hypothetical protein [[Clostridium] fimetarium]|uniref:SH3 domain-containing protein n=1 Tax=[Clostridium] fimetarium TaxID=99656 RepID=A0A1I0REA7_9FIRM|nr:hypothetical protein [[Clostridium] fimetarium]SEW38942.1 hypothetical protein SAMN05421659_11466 [[Clostridium] fimetarium]
MRRKRQLVLSVGLMVVILVGVSVFTMTDVGARSSEINTSDSIYEEPETSQVEELNVVGQIEDEITNQETEYLQEVESIQASNGAASSETSTEDKIKYVNTKTYLRSEPDFECDPNGYIDEWTEVYVIDKGWDFSYVRITSDGVTGYVRNCFICSEEVKDNTIEKNKAIQDEADRKKKLAAGITIGGITVEDTLEKTMIDEINSCLANVPGNLVDGFNKSDWKILVTYKNIASTYGGSSGSWCGLTLTNEHKIILEADGSKFRSSVVHEFFHYVDYSHGWLSNTGEWKSIYEAEKDIFQPSGYSEDGHYKSSAQEFFAEVGQEYCYNPNGVLQLAPRAYAYMLNNFGY